MYARAKDRKMGGGRGGDSYFICFTIVLFPDSPAPKGYQQEIH